MSGAVRQRSLSTYEGWREYAEQPIRTRPDRLTRRQYAALGEGARLDYDQRRREWHANLLLRTDQIREVHAQLWDLVDSNVQDSDRVRSSAAIDAPPALGKSTAANTFGREFHRRQVQAHGEYIDGDTLHLPVCRVSLTGRVTIKGLNQMILGFYAHPAGDTALRRSIAGRDLARVGAECVARHCTRLVIVDDVHFLNMRTRDGVEVANQLKWLANEYHATFLFAGVALTASGLLAEGRSPAEAAMAQTFRRWTLLTIPPYNLRRNQGKSEWRRLLLGIENSLVLADAPVGMLADELSDYLFARSTGTIGSLMDLIRRGASRAIRTGSERIDLQLLEEIRIDEAAETSRAELDAALQKRRQREGQSSSREANPQ